MSAHWLKRLVFAAALAVMPLQGIAATLSFLLCHGEAQAHETHGGQSHGATAGGHHDHKAGSNHDHGAGGDDSSGGGIPYHLCCHFTVTAPVDVTLTLPQQDFPHLALAPERLYDLFIPDRPQRPPLA